MYVHEPEHLANRSFSVCQDGLDQQLANQCVESGLVTLGISPAGIEGLFIKRESYVLHASIICAHITSVHLKRVKTGQMRSDHDKCLF